MGHITSLGHNLIGQTSAITFGLVSTDLVGTHASPLDPELNALADNGGFVETELPELGSPLIDAGDNSLIPAGITTDERRRQPDLRRNRRHRRCRDQLRGDGQRLIVGKPLCE